jgi:hypothetical protein
MHKIFEEEKSIIHIGDKKVYGFISKDKCKICKERLIYYQKYDTLFYAKCNSWTENRCTDLDCNYCSKRPNKPL